MSLSKKLWFQDQPSDFLKDMILPLKCQANHACWFHTGQDSQQSPSESFSES